MQQSLYRYFSSKDEIVAAICEQSSDEVFPSELTAEAIHDMLEQVRARAHEHGHARLVAQIYAEAALSPPLAAIVDQQLAGLRSAVAGLVADRSAEDAAKVAEAFVAMCVGYTQQLAVRGDLDPSPFTTALMAILKQ